MRDLKDAFSIAFYLMLFFAVITGLIYVVMLVV